MTDPKNAEISADGQGIKHRRTRNYDGRRTVSLWMDPGPHEYMMDLCDDLKMPANTYVSGFIETGLKKRKK